MRKFFIWFWLGMLWFKADSILDVLKDIREMLKGGDEK